MGTLKNIVDLASTAIRDENIWVVFYRLEEEWFSTNITMDPETDTIRAEDMDRLIDILVQDAGAVILNGNYCYYLGERLTNIKNLDDGVYYDHENGIDLLCDFIRCSIALDQAIDDAEEKAHAAGLPFCRNCNDEPDMYIFDGTMSPEDYELRATLSASEEVNVMNEDPFTSITVMDPFSVAVREAAKDCQEFGKRMEIECAQCGGLASFIKYKNGEVQGSCECCGIKYYTNGINVRSGDCYES